MKKSTPFLVVLIGIVLYTTVQGSYQESRAWEEAANVHQQNSFFLMQIADLLQGLLLAILFAALYVKKALGPKKKEGE